MTIRDNSSVVPGTEIIERHENYFGKKVMTAIIDHNKKTVTPTHGYCLPNFRGEQNKKYAESIGYNFKNW